MYTHLSAQLDEVVNVGCTKYLIFPFICDPLSQVQVQSAMKRFSDYSMLLYS